MGNTDFFQLQPDISGQLLVVGSPTDELRSLWKQMGKKLKVTFVAPVNRNSLVAEQWPEISEMIIADLESSNICLAQTFDALIFSAKELKRQHANILKATQSLADGGWLVLQSESQDEQETLKCLGLNFEPKYSEPGVFIGRHHSELAVSDLDLEKIEVGQSYSFKKRFTEQDMAQFRTLSGDQNPLHSDNEYANSIGFDNRIVFGLLTASLISRLVGVHMPGLYSLIRETKVFFPNPLLPEQIIDFFGKVDRIDMDKRILQLSFSGVCLENDLQVIRGKVMVSLASPHKNWRLSGWNSNKTADSSSPTTEKNLHE